MYILGAGLAGLLAANIFRKSDPLVVESQFSLPNNHSAVLRHRDHKISEATSIPFKKVKVIKAVNHFGKITTIPTPQICNLYSQKVTGKLLGRSISNLDPVTRYIAPKDFVSQLATGVDIQYGRKVTKEWILSLSKSVPIISTIPMPVMMNMGLVDPIVPVAFEYKSIDVLHTYIGQNCDLYQTVYYTNPKLGLYRLSITGNKVMAEFVFDDYSMPNEKHDVHDANEYISHFLERDFGIQLDKDTNWIKSENKYGKITDIDNSVRKQFIYDLSQQYRIYSLGRFATWRNLLLDDVYDDLMAIQNLMAQRGIF